jgi:hypothetical protein
MEAIVPIHNNDDLNRIYGLFFNKPSRPFYPIRPP